MPGLGIGKAAVLTQTTTSVANTLPAGGAIAVGLTYSILDSWGFSGTSVALYVEVTGIWNIFAKLGLPMLALVFLALSGHLTPTYILAAVFGVIVLGVAIGLFAMLFRSEEFAIRIGNWLGRVASWFRRIRHKPPVATWGDGAARFRRDTIVLVEHRWLRLSVFTVLSQVALFFVLLLSLRALGVSEQEVSTAEAFAVYAFSRLLSAVPITPGGVGLIDLGYIGGLTAFSGEEKQRSWQPSCCSARSRTRSRSQSAGSRTSSGRSSRTGAVLPTLRRSASGPPTRHLEEWPRASALGTSIQPSRTVDGRLFREIATTRCAHRPWLDVMLGAVVPLVLFGPGPGLESADCAPRRATRSPRVCTTRHPNLRFGSTPGCS